MNYKRLFRDCLILLFFCGTFYASTYFTDDAEAVVEQTESEQNYSTVRMEAEQSVQLRHWDDAVDRLKKMIEADPYNGYAWDQLAVSYLSLRREAKRELEGESGGPLPMSDQQISEINQRIQKYEDLSIETLEKTREFLRYRLRATINLAVLYAERDDLERAMERLEEYVTEGGWLDIPPGIDKVPQLGSGGPEMTKPIAFVTSRVRLHQFPRFWELVEIERATRSVESVPRQIQPTMGASQ